MPRSQITSLVEDKYGYLWIGTNDSGLARFDGSNFSAFTRAHGLGSNKVNALLIDQSGVLWIAGERVITRYDGKNFENIKLGQQIQQVFQFRDTIICVTNNNQMYRIYNKSLLDKNPLSPQLDVREIISFDATAYFLINSRSELFLRNDTGLHKVDFGRKTVVYNLLKGGAITHAQTSSGIYALDGGGGTTLVEPRAIWPSIAANDSLKTIWLTDNNKLIRISLYQHEITRDTIAIGTSIITSLVDGEGVAWFGTNSNGLMRVLPMEFEKLKGFYGSVLSVLAEPDRLWVGTENRGLLLFKGDKVIKRYRFSSKQNDSVNSIKKDDEGNIWVGTNAGLIQLQNEYIIRWITKKDGLPSDSVFNLAFDENSNVWMSFNYGKSIGIWNRSSYLTVCHAETESEFFQDVVFAPIINKVFFNTNNSVEYIEDGARKKLIIPKFSEEIIYSIDLYKEQYLLIGSATKGIALYNLLTDSVKYFSVGGQRGIPYCVRSDEDNNIWLTSDAGVTCIVLDLFFTISQYYTFGKLEGLNIIKSSFNTIDLRGRSKYIGFSDGLFKLKAAVRGCDPPLILENISLNYGEERIVSDEYSCEGFNYLPLNPVFPPNKNHLTFQFLRIRKSNPESVVYQYKLEGWDEKWSPTTRQNKVTYAKLSPGEYTFKVRSNGENGVMTLPSINYSFIIEPPFYKTKLFVVVVSFFLLVVFAILFSFQVDHRVRSAMTMERARQNERSNLRKEIGRDFHDEMGNKLARIINQVGMIKLNRIDINTSLKHVEESAKDLLIGTKDFIWSLDPESDRLSNLFAHAKDFGESLFNGSGIEFSAFYDFEIEFGLYEGYARQINFIIKEAMTNSLKHSGCTTIELHMRADIEKNELEVVISDNGIGFPIEQLSKSTGGLSNMVDRARKIRGRLEFEGKVNEGSTVRLIIQLLNQSTQ